MGGCLESVLSDLNAQGFGIGSPVFYTTSRGQVYDAIVLGAGYECDELVIDVMTEDGKSRWGWAEQVKPRVLRGDGEE